TWALPLAGRPPAGRRPVRVPTGPGPERPGPGGGPDGPEGPDSPEPSPAKPGRPVVTSAPSRAAVRTVPSSPTSDRSLEPVAPSPGTIARPTAARSVAAVCSPARSSCGAGSIEVPGVP